MDKFTLHMYVASSLQRLWPLRLSSKKFNKIEKEKGIRLKHFREQVVKDLEISSLIEVVTASSLSQRMSLYM